MFPTDCRLLLWREWADSKLLLNTDRTQTRWNTECVRAYANGCTRMTGSAVMTVNLTLLLISLRDSPMYECEYDEWMNWTVNQLCMHGVLFLQYTSIGWYSLNTRRTPMVTYDTRLFYVSQHICRYSTHSGMNKRRIMVEFWFHFNQLRLQLLQWDQIFGDLFHPHFVSNQLIQTEIYVCLISSFFCSLQLTAYFQVCMEWMNSMNDLCQYVT